MSVNKLWLCTCARKYGKDIAYEFELVSAKDPEQAMEIIRNIYPDLLQDRGVSIKPVRTIEDLPNQIQQNERSED